MLLLKPRAEPTREKRPGARDRRPRLCIGGSEKNPSEKRQDGVNEYNGRELSHPPESVVIGLLSDTHLPYRAKQLAPAVLSALEGVDLILHAGDVDEPEELAPLRALAPLYAVRGNYHVRERSHAGASLPWSVELTVCGFHLVVEHGHRIGPALWLWKIVSVIRRLITHKWDFPALEARMIRALRERHPQADIIVFGHTHRYYHARHGNILFLNPGAAMPTAYLRADDHASIIRLHLQRGRDPCIERILLPEDNLHLQGADHKTKENP